MRTCKGIRNKRSSLAASTMQAELLPCTSAVVLVVDGEKCKRDWILYSMRQAARDMSKPKRTLGRCMLSSEEVKLGSLVRESNLIEIPLL